MGKRLREDDEDSLASSQGILQTGQSPAKIIELEDEEFDHICEGSKMQCLLPPHLPLSFDSTENFDIHYLKEHTNRCSSCGRNFPSTHYLDLHMDENHNPVRESKAASGEKTYACFIENCEKLCSTPQKRRLHLIDKHMFPKAYNFRIVDRGIDKADSMLQTGPRRRLSTNTPKDRSRPPPNVNGCTTNNDGPQNAKENQLERPLSNNLKCYGFKTESPSSEVGKLTISMSNLKFIPSTVRAKQHSKKSVTQV